MSQVEKKIDIVSVGDCVMDFFSYVDRMPKIGETYIANNYICSTGGKGANEVVAASRLGSCNAFISKLGKDHFGKEFIEVLQNDKINTDHVSFSNDAPTSVATIVVDKIGHNFCVVNRGATLDLIEADIDNAEELIKNSKILIVTRMIKEATALHALKMAKKHDLVTIFNFAPATNDLNEEFNEYVDILVVNEIEAEAFTDSRVKNLEDANKACQIVLSRNGFYIGCIVTLGENGCVYGDKKTGNIQHFPCKPVEVIDSTGAGDSFVGSLGHYLCFLGKESINQAIELAGDYASLTVKKSGTQVSYPYLADIEAKFNVTRK